MTVIFLAGALPHGIGVPQALFTYLDETNLSSRLSALCSLGQVEFREWLVFSGVGVAFVSCRASVFFVAHVPYSTNANHYRRRRPRDFHGQSSPCELWTFLPFPSLFLHWLLLSSYSIVLSYFMYTVGFFPDSHFFWFPQHFSFFSFYRFVSCLCSFLSLNYMFASFFVFAKNHGTGPQARAAHTPVNLHI